ncbi:ABC transporter permease [Methanobacterium sp. ACI-7]|uniref:ABC transporter permease n=1 Tax=unclassified Methanobacterium TaxID=2627676 RepID=UPI0039C0A033
MRFFTITKWEFKNSLSSKKFLSIFLLQISVLILMVVFFNFFNANIEAGEGMTLSPSLTGFASIDVSDKSGIFPSYLNKEVLKINNLDSNESISNVNNGKVTAALIIPENFTMNIDEIKTTNLNLFINQGDPKRSVATEEVNSTIKVMKDSISNRWIKALAPETSVIQPDVREEKTGESIPIKLIRKMMIVVLLFIPLFLFGNMIVDSIVGEKERKTGEILVAMPLSHTDIIIGKNMAVVLTIALQVAIWIIILLGAGFDINSPLLVYIVIVLTAIPIVGITSVVAAYSKNYKEAGIGLSFIYLTIVGFLILPALAYISGQMPGSNISPMTLVMRIFSGESISTGELLIPLVSIILISIITFWLTIKLFKRDDIMFGPRPGIIRLTLKLMGVKK